MSGTFKGFTDQDIEQLKNPKKDAPTPFKKGILKNKTTNAQSVTIRKMPGEQRVEILDNNARLSKSETIIITQNNKDETIDKIESTDISQESVDEKMNDVNSANSLDTFSHIESKNHEITEFKDIELNEKCDEDVIFEKRINLEEFQKTQKLIEEQNRKRKEMLAKALEDRSKKTAEEVEKINAIKKELQALDNQLSDDVSILRKKIEKACLVYTEAEKTYFRVEKEFLSAKLTLQKEKERKELLTEHLCTLIAHNEARKAKKLESLMDQLAYDAIGDKPSSSPVPAVCDDGVCEKTGKILEMENGKVIQREED